MAKQFKKNNNKVQKVKKKQEAVQIKNAGRIVALPKGDFIATVGRRKTAAARVRLFTKPGDYVVNDLAMTDYFSSQINPESRFLEPFRVTDTVGKFAVSVKVLGSGASAQLDAAIHGIARALIQVDSSYRKVLKDAGLLTRDARMKETRKPGRGGSARTKRQSPKR